MYMTHFFRTPESISRALAYLSQLGFAPAQIEVHSDAYPRISLNFLDALHAAKARLLFNALDTTDPDGPFSFFDVGRQSVTGQVNDLNQPAETQAPPAFSRSVIHFEREREPLPIEADWSDRRRESARLM